MLTDRQSAREDPKVRTGKQGTNKQTRGQKTEEKRKMRQKLQCLEDADKLPPFPETAKKKRNQNQRSIRAEMISSPTEVDWRSVPIDHS